MNSASSFLPGHQTPVGTDLESASSVLQRGGTVAIPTETVYGLAADAFQSLAVAKIFEAKNRPTFDPLIVHLAHADWLPRVARHVPPLAMLLLERFWPGPLTIVLEKSEQVSDLVTSGLPTVAVRVPDHPLTQKLLEQCQTPLAAPSANLFGRTSPTTAQHVCSQLNGRIDYILDGGPSRVGVESTIVRVHEDEIQLLRPGGVSLEELEHYGPVSRISLFEDNSQSQAAPLVPGQLKEHYAPQTPLKIFTPENLPTAGERTGLLILSRALLPADYPVEMFAKVIELAPDGNLTQAAARFFAALHELDAENLHEIRAIPFPETGLGLALNDRLKRAAHE